MFPFRSGRVGSDGVGCGVYSVVCLMLDVEGVGIGGVACDYSCGLKGTLTKIFPRYRLFLNTTWETLGSCRDKGWYNQDKSTKGR